MLQSPLYLFKRSYHQSARAQLCSLPLSNHRFPAATTAGGHSVTEKKNMAVKPKPMATSLQERKQHGAEASPWHFSSLFTQTKLTLSSLTPDILLQVVYKHNFLSSLKLMRCCTKDRLCACHTHTLPKAIYNSHKEEPWTASPLPLLLCTFTPQVCLWRGCCCSCSCATLTFVWTLNERRWAASLPSSIPNSC